MPTRHGLTALLFFALAVLLAGGASADTRVLLCFPGGPGSTEQAQPIVDEFLAKLAPVAGWSKASGHYTNDMDACKKAMTDGGAQVVMLPLDVYLAERQAWKLSPVATLANKETASKYHIVAKAGVTAEQLKGVTVSTGLSASDSFLSRIAFDGVFDCSADFKLTRERSALRAIKNVVRGKVVAAILNDVEQKALDGLPMAKDLVTVSSGPSLPGAIVASAGSPDPKLAAALREVCSKHKDICAKMRVSGFNAVDAGQLTELEKKLSK